VKSRLKLPDLHRPMKILAIQFRYFGDAALMIPALRALKEFFPDAAVHVLVPEEVTPLFRHLPWLSRVWAMPRTRGRALFQQSWPVLRALRQERFERSVDFGGNDRSAILSLLCGATVRLGPLAPGGFLGRRFCYTQRVPFPDSNQHEIRRNLHVLSAWKVAPPRSYELEIHADPALADFARKILPEPVIVCHLATTQPKKEWPLPNWASLFKQASAAGLKLVFSTGKGAREEALLEEFRKLAPAAPVLPAIPDLGAFLAVLKRARLFISGDTGPLHFAAGLGVPTIGLFGPTSAAQWAPIGPQHQAIQAPKCSCGGSDWRCSKASHCLASISSLEVFKRLQSASARSKTDRIWH